MALEQKLADLLPFLRRYARALCGSQTSGDAYVRELLEAAVIDSELRDKIVRSRLELYRCFTRIWSNGHVEIDPENGPDNRAELVAGERLKMVSPIHRQALLLTTLEEFTPQDAAEILGVSAQEVDELVAQAVAEIEGESVTRVLIIEDEPLIAMQLEAIVSEAGHAVVATAATRDQALKAFQMHGPGLVLADIQLADASSGIDAIEDILRLGDVPVVFITAYPERMLTGQRPEPTYLVTKPFRDETVRAAISQALFFAGKNLGV
ncbi:MAG: response regulator [Cypionkella sp.]